MVAAPASASTNVICVLPAVTGCNQTVATIPAAIAAADANNVDDTILLGAATYLDGPYALDGFNHAVTLQGAGQGSTILTLPPNVTGQTYVSASTATVADLTILMSAVTSTGDAGLSLNNHSSADHVTVNATGTANARGIDTGLSTISHSAVIAPASTASADRGIYSGGGNILSDVAMAGSPGFELSDPGTIDALSHVTIRSDGYAVTTDGGGISLDDAVIDLGVAANAVGLAAVNQNNSANLKTITADHVTIVGGGTGSRGAWAYAAAPGAVQTTTVSLTNSIVRGPATSLVADASNDGAQGGPSTATLNVSHTDYETTGGTVDTAGGTGAGGIVAGAGNLVGVDPGFVSASDRHLTAGSAVVDKGDPAAGGPATDLDGTPRVQDGDLDGVAVRDMGAYELADTTPPDTTVDTGPNGPTGDSTPTFSFSSTEAGSSFVCQVDAGSESACSSPLTTQPLGDGPHTLTVTATDPVGNTDATPATRQWVVDTVAPDTTISSGPAGPAGPTSDSTPTFTFTSEPGASFECKIDAASYAACATPFTTSALADGTHTISVRAVDAAANPDATPATRTFTVDTVAPAVTITKKPAKRTTQAKVKIAFTSEAGASFECQVDGKAWKPCGSPLRLKVKLGKHTVLVRATDAAGNVDATPAKVRFRRLPKP